MVKRIRAAWPGVKIILRGDSGFCREELMAWCEANRVEYVFGMARNSLLEKIVAETLEQARRQAEESQRAARVFVEFEHETVSGTWSRRRRVVPKAEHIDGKSNRGSWSPRWEQSIGPLSRCTRNSCFVC
jgi:hypothetical protein